MRRARDGSELPDARRISFNINTDVDRPHFIAHHNAHAVGTVC